MPATDQRFMRLMVFFDLPVKSSAERKRAALFRRFLMNDGYVMLQWSVYCRLCKGEDVVDKHLKRLEAALPGKGNIRALTVTETQFSRMKLLIGTTTKEENFGNEQLLLF